MKPQGQPINGPVLRAFRTRMLQLSVTEAASRIDVSHGLWSQWENGGRGISPQKLESLRLLFGLEDARPLLAQTAEDSIKELERQRQRRNKQGAAA